MTILLAAFASFSAQNQKTNKLLIDRDTLGMLYSKALEAKIHETEAKRLKAEFLFFQKRSEVLLKENAELKEKNTDLRRQRNTLRIVIGAFVAAFIVYMAIAGKLSFFGTALSWVRGKF